MIPLLRVGSLLANVTVSCGVPLLLGAPWPMALTVLVLFFALTWWGCGHLPRCETAPPELVEAAARAAQHMNAPAPRFVGTLSGWTAAAVRRGRGYAILVGSEVAPEHREAVIAHEIAHFVTGDLAWEPFTDGPARLLLQASRTVPPLVVITLPFLLCGAPLARATELRADCLAARAVSSYPTVLREVAGKMGAGPTLLYPSARTRILHSARDSVHTDPTR